MGLKKDSVTWQIKSDHHKVATYIKLEQELGSEDYQKKVIYENPVPKSFLKLSDVDRARLCLKINAVSTEALVTLQSLSKTFGTPKEK